MLVCFWSPKGGSGTSVFAAAAALVLAREAPARVADLAGDLPAVLGLAHDPDPGLRDWLRIGPEAPTDALDRFAVDAAPGLALLGAGVGRPRRRSRPKPAPRSRSRSAPTPARRSSTPVSSHRTRRARTRSSRSPTRSVIVVRGCYLALRRAVAIELTTRATGAVFVDEPGRSLGPRDVENVLGVPVLATVALQARRPRGRSTRVCWRLAFPTRSPVPRASVLRRIGGIAARRRRDASDRGPAAPRRRCTGGCSRRRSIPPPSGRASCGPASTMLLRDEAPLVTDAAAASVSTRWSPRSEDSDRSQPLLADPSIIEIMVNGPDRVFVERDGGIEPVPVRARRRDDRAHRPARDRAARSAARSRVADGRRRDSSDGSRLHAVLPPLAPDGPCLTIRRFTLDVVGLDAFGVDPPVAEFLATLVRAGWNIVVAGATSAGKTTCANALARAIDPAERIVTIEETAELRLGQPHVVRLEARPANAEGAGAVGVRELVRAALRMRPDRLVVGEVRGGEAFDMLQALNTGHDGSVSTVHANSPADALAATRDARPPWRRCAPVGRGAQPARVRDRPDRASRRAPRTEGGRSLKSRR